MSFIDVMADICVRYWVLILIIVGIPTIVLSLYFGFSTIKHFLPAYNATTACIPCNCSAVIP